MPIEIIDETKTGLDSKIAALCNEFYSGETLSILKNKNILIKVSTNFERDVFENSTKEQQKHMTQKGITNHATTIIPSDLDYSKFIIFLRASVFNDFQYYSTLYHEFTHTIDFINYFNDFGNAFIQDEFSKQNLYYYYEFYFWTEYNAKRRGLERFLTEIQKYEYQINLEGATQNFLQTIQSTNIQFIRLYELVHFFARLSLYEKDSLSSFNSTVFPEDFIIKTFGNSSIKLYSLLKQLNDYRKFKENILPFGDLIYQILE